MQLDPFGSEFTVDKVHAAHWQLSTAIRMHFIGDNPVVVLALASNAAEVFAALVEHTKPGKSWDAQSRDVHGMTKAEYNGIMRRGQNFLKHADRDPEGTLTWTAADTEARLIFAVLNAGELDGGLAPIEIVFRDWYFALHLGGRADAPEYVAAAEHQFPALRIMPIQQQRALGWQRFVELEAKLDADSDT